MSEGSSSTNTSEASSSSKTAACSSKAAACSSKSSDCGPSKSANAENAGCSSSSSSCPAVKPEAPPRDQTVLTESDMEKKLDLEVATSSQAVGVIINGMEFEGHAVDPRSDCPHQKGSVNPIPQSLDIFGPCVECGSTGENWICLSCHTLHCSRFVNGHMQEHGLCNLHMVVLSIADISVWCYGCDDYIDNKGLYDVKNFVHQAKFGSPIPFYYHDSDDD